jgi:hypothetical protein
MLQDEVITGTYALTEIPYVVNIIFLCLCNYCEAPETMSIVLYWAYERTVSLDTDLLRSRPTFRLFFPLRGWSC